MKARTVICMIVMLMALIGPTAYGNNSTSGNDNGQKTYKPMLKDGRVWNCIEIHYKAGKLDTLTHEYRIEGTIEKDGHVCYNLYRGSNQIGLYYEEGAKVFRYTASGWELLFDFSLSPGEVASEYNTVGEVKTIVMKGVPRRCLFFPWVSCWWIEGIGSSFSGPNYFNFDIPVIGSFVCMKLVSVYDGDVCIFEYDDLMANPAVEINEENFPDENFRNWVLSQEYGKDGVLTDEEIAIIKIINVYGKGIKSLKGIEYLTAVSDLECVNNQLTELDVSKNTALGYLECSGNPLTSLNVSGCTALGDLICTGTPLTKLDVSGCPKLEYLSCPNNQITTLNVSKNTALTSLKCSGNQLTVLDVSGCTALGDLYCDGNQLTSLDLSKNTKLYALACYNNQLTTLDVSQNTKLQWVAFHQNQIKGAAMDAFLESLPTVDNRTMNVIHNVNEHNVMTKSQVAAARAKHWEPLYYDSSSWQKYEGSEPIEPVIFTKDQMATIILPTALDASKGKYYRLDRVEDGQIIFEQELQPQARVPYIIVPDEDFSIDPSTLNLEGLTQDEVSIEGVSFIGSYHREELPALTGGDGEESSYIDLIDTTSDCGVTISAETGKETLLIGALRAYLIVSWDDPINPGGARSPKDKLEIVLKDFKTGIGDAQRLNDKGQMINEKWYDLQGRRIDNSKFIIQNSSQSSGAGGAKLPKGVYIKDKKKVFKK